MITVEKHYDYFYVASYFLVFLTDIHLIIVHVLNIYSIRQEYLKNDFKYYYIKWFGIPKQETNFSVIFI